MLLKIFNRLFLLLLCVCGTIGFILPALTSARSDIAFLAGVGIIVGSIYVTVRSVLKLVEEESK